MRILEVAFDDYVRRPESSHNTNVLRVTFENAIGTAATVDVLEEDEVGIVATKTVKGQDGTTTTYKSRYPWGLVKDVKYEPHVVKPEPEKKK